MAVEAKYSQEAIRIEFCDCSESEDDADATEYLKNALRFDDEHVYAVVALDEDLVMEATIDTGSTNSLISKYFADELRNDGNVIKVMTLIKLADDSTVTAEEALVIDVRLGNCYHRTKLLILPQVRDEIILGMDFLCGVDAALQLCGEVIKLQHNQLMKEKEENINLNPKPNSHSLLASVMNSKQATIPTSLSEAKCDNMSTMPDVAIDEGPAVKKIQYNIVPTGTCQKSYSSDDETRASTSSNTNRVIISESEFHCLPLNLQMEIANVKPNPKKTRKFKRIYDGVQYKIKFKKNGLAHVVISDVQKQQSDNNSIRSNQPLTQSINQSVLGNENAMQSPVTPFDCSAALAVFPDLQMPCMPNSDPQAPPGEKQPFFISDECSRGSIVFPAKIQQSYLPHCISDPDPEAPAVAIKSDATTYASPPAAQMDVESSFTGYECSTTHRDASPSPAAMPSTVKPASAATLRNSDSNTYIWVPITSESYPVELVTYAETLIPIVKSRRSSTTRAVDGVLYRVRISRSGGLKVWMRKIKPEE